MDRLDVGRRRALNDQAKAAYVSTVASYRQTVLNAFQQVEDNLAALRILEQEAGVQARAVDAAQTSLSLSNIRYDGGVTSYLEVITAENAALSDEVTAVNILDGAWPARCYSSRPWGAVGIAPACRNGRSAAES